MNRHILSLYFIMGSNNTNESPVHVLQQAIEGGITCFQFREKGHGALVGKEKQQLARELQQVCQANGVPFFVNDDLKLALELEADGIHVGQDDIPVREIKKLAPASMLVGVSAKTLEEAKSAVEDGADYIGTGPMFITSTKEDADVPVGPERIRFLREEGMTLPIVGIGGIHEKNAHHVLEAGADGIAVISAISMSRHPKQATSDLKKILMENGRNE